MQKMIDELRLICNSWDTIDPETNAYRSLVSFLDAQSLENLKILRDAKIKFLSSLAVNRIVRIEMAK